MAKTVMKNAPLLAGDELSARLSELHLALEQFNNGYWFESHETLEDLWQETSLPERTMFQGIIQASAALVHFARGEYPGIMKLLDAAIDKLQEFRPSHLGIDVDALIRDLERVRAEFEALGEARFLQWDERTAPRVLFSRAI
jgi:predicted metal-dependent hydrolase